MAHVWSLEGSLWESFLIFHEGSGGWFQDGAQVIRLGSKYLYLLRHSDSTELFLNSWDMKSLGHGWYFTVLQDGAQLRAVPVQSYAVIAENSTALLGKLAIQAQGENQDSFPRGRFPWLAGGCLLSRGVPT